MAYLNNKCLRIIMVLCITFLVAVCCVSPILYKQGNNVARGADTANLSVSFEKITVDYGLDCVLSICNTDGQIVYSQAFKGASVADFSVPLVVGQEYSIAVYVPTGMSTQMTLNDQIVVYSNYFSPVFVMPSGGSTLLIQLYMFNPTLFVDSTTV